MIEQRDLLLVPFPFSDQSQRKVRPVVVISNNNFNKYSEDILVTGVTSYAVKEKYTIKLTNKDLESGKLFTKCYVKVSNILKIDKNLIIKKIGKIKKDKLKDTFAAIKLILN
jgi:mRNA interferase MazF